MTRSRTALLMWLAFVLLVAATMAILLRACGLLMPAFGWNFCPAAPPALSSETQRGEELSKLARQLELEIAQKNLECASIPPPPPPPLELPTQRGPVRPQQTAELKPPPPPPPKPSDPPKPLPADRWNNKDLSLLKGCWQLGHETRTSMSRAGGVGPAPFRPARSASARMARGERERIAQSTGAYSCRAPVTATFGDGGTLRTTQPQVTCSPSSIT